MYEEVFRSPNFGYPKGSHGRCGQKIIGVCLHITGAAWQSNYHWIMNPAANASYNAVVRDDGSVVSLVPEENAAYSHGRINRATWPLLKRGINPNLYTLSLARTGANQRTWTGEQLASTLQVLAAWSKRYDFPLQRPYVFGHFEIDSIGRWYCPGEGFFERVITALPGLENAGQESAGGALWYRVVTASFREAQNALRHRDDLESIGINAFIVRHRDAENNLWHRVIAGSYRAAEQARLYAGRLHTIGIDAFIVTFKEG